MIKDNFPFEFNHAACISCLAACCKGSSGNIWVNSADIRNICHILEINQIDGINKFFEKRGNRYSIRECVDDKDYRCIFLNSANRCSIYSVRPLQCRTFPFWEHFKRHTEQLINECPGVQKLIDF
ncbi:MAG: YkgJ family cysteine cluster protein [Desulfamplus sp.]|nr:YkgJ family cysteine cluster protein [Desulfamplus sp.]